MEKLQQTNEDNDAMTNSDLTDLDRLAQTTEASPKSAATTCDDEAFLARIASEINALPERDDDTLTEAGRLLSEARKRLPQEDPWLAWLEREFGWSKEEDKASKLIELHKASVEVERSRANPPPAHPIFLFREKEREAHDALRYGVGLSLGCRDVPGVLDFDKLMEAAEE